MLLDDSNLDVMLCPFLPIKMQQGDFNFKEKIKQRYELQTLQNDKNFEQNSKINEYVSKKYSNRRDVVPYSTLFSPPNDCHFVKLGGD